MLQKTSPSLLKDDPQSGHEKFNLILPLWRITYFFILVVILLTVFSVFGQLLYYYFPDFFLSDDFDIYFNLDRERNIPTLFSTFLLFTSAILLHLIYKVKQRISEGFAKYWRILSYVFLYLALDEFLTLHEKTIPIFRSLGLTGVFHYGWVLIPLILLPVMLIFFLRFLLSLPAYTLKLFLFAALLYIGGAVGLEMLNGLHISIYGIHNVFQQVLVTCEEMLEMFGMVIFIHALQSYLTATHAIDVNFKMCRGN